VAGPYTATYNAVPLGIFRGEGGVPTISQTTYADINNSTNIYGRTTIEGFHLGADWFCEMTPHEWRAGVLSAIWPWGTLGAMGPISASLYGQAQPLVLTVVAGTPAAAPGPGPQTITAPKAILAPGSNPRYFLGPQGRYVPLRLQLILANLGGGLGGHSIT
jgi:hypothetical protein